MERTLVVVIAETRAHEYSFPSFRANVLEALNADLALCIAKNQWEDTSNPFYQHARYLWTYEEPDDWGSAFDAAQIVEGCQGDWRCLLDLDGIWMGGVHNANGRTRGSGSILLFFRWLLKHSLMKSGVDQKYDRFIITRSDYIYLTPHYPIRQLDPEVIWIPEGEDYGGYTDRHIVVSRKDLTSILSVADPILCSPEELRIRMSGRKEWNLEKYIRFAFCELGLDQRVRRFPYTMFAVRSVDGRTSWSTGSYSSERGYCIKYRDEHRKSLIASKMIVKPDDWTPAATLAFFQVAEMADRIQDFTSRRVHTIANVRLRNFLCKAIYGTVLSDGFHGSVYAQLCRMQAFLINRLDRARTETKMQQLGFRQVDAQTNS